MSLPLEELWLACHRVFSHLQAASVPLARAHWGALQRACRGYRLAAASLADKAEARAEALAAAGADDAVEVQEALFSQSESLRLVHAVLQLLEVGYCTPSQAALAAASEAGAEQPDWRSPEEPPCLVTALVQWLRDNFIPALEDTDIRAVFATGAPGLPAHAAFDTSVEADAWDCVSRLFMEGRIYEAAEVVAKIGSLQRDPDTAAFGELLGAFPATARSGSSTATSGQLAWTAWKERAERMLARGVWSPSRNPVVHALLQLCSGRLGQGLRSLPLLGGRAAGSLGAAADAEGRVTPFNTWYYALLCLVMYGHPTGTVPRGAFVVLLRQALSLTGQEYTTAGEEQHSGTGAAPSSAEMLGSFVAVLSGVPEAAIRLLLRLDHPWAACHAADLLWRAGYLSDPRTQTSFTLPPPAPDALPSAYDAFFRNSAATAEGGGEGGSAPALPAPARPSLLLLHAHGMLAASGGRLWPAAATYAAAATASGVAACFPADFLPPAPSPLDSRGASSGAAAVLEVAVRSGSTAAAEEALRDTLVVFALQHAMGGLGHAGSPPEHEEEEEEEQSGTPVTDSLARCEAEVVRVLLLAEALGLKQAVLEAAASAWVAAACGAATHAASQAAPAPAAPAGRPPHPSWLGSALAWALTREAAAATLPAVKHSPATAPSPLHTAALALLTFLRQALAQPLHQWKTWAALGGSLVLDSASPQAAAAAAGLAALPPPPALDFAACPPYGLPAPSAAVLASLDDSLALAIQSEGGGAKGAPPHGHRARVVADTVHACLAALSATASCATASQEGPAWARPLQHLFLALPAPIPAAASASAPLRLFVVYQAVLCAAAAAAAPPAGIDAEVARRWAVCLVGAAVAHSQDAMLEVPTDPRLEAYFPAWSATELLYLLGAAGLLRPLPLSAAAAGTAEAGWWAAIRARLLAWDAASHSTAGGAASSALPSTHVLYTLAALTSPP